MTYNSLVAVNGRVSFGDFSYILVYNSFVWALIYSFVPLILLSSCLKKSIVFCILNVIIIMVISKFSCCVV